MFNINLDNIKVGTYRDIMFHYPNLYLPDSDETAPDEDEVDGGCGRESAFFQSFGFS